MCIMYRFQMTAVLPGKYMIKASHSKWTIQKVCIYIWSVYLFIHPSANLSIHKSFH